MSKIVDYTWPPASRSINASYPGKHPAIDFFLEFSWPHVSKHGQERFREILALELSKRCGAFVSWYLGEAEKKLREFHPWQIVEKDLLGCIWTGLGNGLGQMARESPILKAEADQLYDEAWDKAERIVARLRWGAPDPESFASKSWEKLLEIVSKNYGSVGLTWLKKALEFKKPSSEAELLAAVKANRKYATK
jgi:hypothetical protein